MKYSINFADGARITIDMDEENVIVDNFSERDEEFNNIAEKAMSGGNETNYLRFLNLINYRVREEIV